MSLDGLAKYCADHGLEGLTCCTGIPGTVGGAIVGNAGAWGEQIGDVLGSGADIRECFRFVNSKAGEGAMAAAQLTQRHKELLLYFSSMILDPDGHRRWMENVRNRLER